MVPKGSLHIPKIDWVRFPTKQEHVSVMVVCLHTLQIRQLTVEQNQEQRITLAFQDSIESHSQPFDPGWYGITERRPPILCTRVIRKLQRTVCVKASRWMSYEV